MDGVAPCAKPVVPRLEVESAVEIERWAVFVKLSAHPHPVGKNEIDLLRTRQECALDCGDRNALWTLLFDPVELGDEAVGLNRHTQDHFILNDEARDGLANVRRLRGKKAEQ